MPTTDIATYRDQEHAIKTHESGEETPSAYRTWRNFVSRASVRAIALALGSRRLWLATWGGIVSWDPQGHPQQQRFGSEHGLAGNAVAYVCVDADGRTWAASEEGGLCYWDGQRWYVHPDQVLREERVRAFCSAGARGGIWAAVDGKVYHVPDPTRDPVATPVAVGEDDALAHPQTLLPDGDGLLLGNGWGLYRLEHGERTVLAPDTVHSCPALARDGLHRIWVATPTAIYPLVGNTLGDPIRPAADAPQGRIMALAAGRNRLWVLTTIGLAYVQDGQWQPVPWTSSAPSPFALQAVAAHSQDDYAWLGTDRGLMFVRCPPHQAPQWGEGFLPAHPDDGLHSLGTCLAGPAEDGGIWAGSANGLHTFDSDGTWTLAYEGHHVRSLCLDGQLGLWVLTWPQGIYCPGAPAPLLPPNRELPLVLAAGMDGYVYCATSHGLWRITADYRWIQVITGLPEGFCCLAQTADATWWVGTDSGVFRQYDARWKRAGERPGPWASGVRDMTVSGQSLWVATETGLWAWQEDKWQLHDQVAEGKPAHIWSLAPAGDGKLWLASDQGVVLYDPATQKVDGHHRHTPAGSGLASLRVTSMLAATDYLWICTQAGVSRLALQLDAGGRS